MGLPGERKYTKSQEPAAKVVARESRGEAVFNSELVSVWFLDSVGLSYAWRSVLKFF